MHAYSQDLRDRVLGALERGEGPTAIAKRYEVSRLWVYQVRKRWQEDGQRHSLPMGGYRRSRIAHKEVQIRQWIEATPDLTLVQLSERLAEQGIQIKVPALWHQLDKWGLSFKKKPCTPASSHAPTYTRHALNGLRTNRAGIVGIWSFSMKRPRPPT